jgi:hypothetical protein
MTARKMRWKWNGEKHAAFATRSSSSGFAFYKKLGFEPSGGDLKRWAILRNGPAVIGLFQGMFEKNMLTFNPGWDGECAKLEAFTDVRDLQKQLRRDGIEPVKAADEASKGPASFVVVDPDGNPVLVDQHV